MQCYNVLCFYKKKIQEFFYAIDLDDEGRSFEKYILGGCKI